MSLDSRTAEEAKAPHLLPDLNILAHHAKQFFSPSTRLSFELVLERPSLASTNLHTLHMPPE